jgi:predicted acyltransferase
MFGMILVNNQGGHPIWPLDESDWNGISTADLIFPSFLFIMGFAVPLAVKNPFKPLRLTLRAIGLFLIGFLLHLLSNKFDFTTVRILGVLQRISLCYVMVVAIHFLTQYAREDLRKYGAMFVALMSALYMGLMLSFSDGPDCTKLNNLSQICNFTRWLDMKTIQYDHMMKPTDP